MVVNDVQKLSAAGIQPFVSFDRGGIPAELARDLRYFLNTWL